MRKLILIFAALLFPMMAHAQMIQGGAKGVIPAGLGGPHYAMARTDFTMTLTPAVIPSVGGSTGVGNCTSQPGYANNEVCRVTDINSESGSAGNANKQHFGPCCGGSADYPEWSADSRMFFIGDNGGNSFLMRMDDSVDPPVFSCVGSGNVWVTPATNCITMSTWLGGGSAPPSGFQWSETNPLVFYGAENSTQIWKFTLNGATAAPPTATMLFDLTTAPNCAPSFGGAAHLGPWRASWDGQKFGGIYSEFGQDLQFQLFDYDLTQGCRWMNSLTWQVGGNWGPTGTAVVQPAISVTNSAITSNLATLTLAQAANGFPLLIKNPSTPAGFAITAATNASPIVLTTATACACNDQVIGVNGVLGNTAANGTWLATQSGTSVTLLHVDGTNSTGNGAYTSGGTLFASGSIAQVSGMTHCAACNGAPLFVTSFSGSTVTLAVNGADVASGADTGTIVDSGQLHEVAMSGDGNAILLSVSATQNSLHPFWQPSTLNVFNQAGHYNGVGSSSLSTGHYAFDFSHFVSATQGVADASFCGLGVSETDVPNLTAMTFFMPKTANCPTWTGNPAYDEHDSITTLSKADNFPAFHETVNLTSAPNTTFAAMQDIVAHSYSDLGTLWRFCTTYQDTFSDKNGSDGLQTFSSYEGTGTVSPNGKWYVFSSDWGSTLGADASWTITSGSWASGTETITINKVSSTNPVVGTDTPAINVGVNSNQSDVNGSPFAVTAVGGSSGAWTFSYALATNPSVQPTGGTAGPVRDDTFVCRLR